MPAQRQSVNCNEFRIAENKQNFKMRTNKVTTFGIDAAES